MSDERMPFTGIEANDPKLNLRDYAAAHEIGLFVKYDRGTTAARIAHEVREEGRQEGYQQALQDNTGKRRPSLHAPRPRHRQ